MKTLKWCGLDHDEGPALVQVHEHEHEQEHEHEHEHEQIGNVGPYVQSERLEIYEKYADKLVDSGHAYPCFYWCR